MSAKDYSHLRGKTDAARAVSATKKAIKGLCEMAGMSLPENRTELDDKPEMVEQEGSVGARAIFTEVKKCLGFACPVTSDHCDICRFFEGNEEIDPQYDEDFPAPTGRGRLAVIQFSGRTRF